MNEISGQLQEQVSDWLQALEDGAGPCGADLEYDPDFLALERAAAGKPESQFGPAEPPDWRAVAEIAEGLLARTRDLRIAVHWLRAQVHIEGYAALVPGFALLDGLLELHWEQVHPLPDFDDSDPQYPRLNALARLHDNEGLIGDLRGCRLLADRAIGEVTGRQLELALSLSAAREDEATPTRDALTQVLGAGVQRHPELRDVWQAVQTQLVGLMSRFNATFGVGEGPDLRPVHVRVQGLMSLVPAADEAVDEDIDTASDDGSLEGSADGELNPRAARSAKAGEGLPSRITSRADALRAIDLVCDYLEAAEPTNPAPLFLRRARRLVDFNFLQLMKVLAPDSLSSFAGVVGIDPDSVEDPERPPDND